MPKIVTKIILSVLLFPTTDVLRKFFYYYLMNTRFRQFNEALAFWSISLLSFVFVVICWLALWGSSVRWTRLRIRLTWSIFCACAVLMVLGYWICKGNESTTLAMTIQNAAALVPLAWCIALAFVWQETRKERVERLGSYHTDIVVCPICNYNLTGLREPRCPECGNEFTLDVLLSAQGDRR